MERSQGIHWQMYDRGKLSARLPLSQQQFGDFNFKNCRNNITSINNLLLNECCANVVAKWKIQSKYKILLDKHDRGA